MNTLVKQNNFANGKRIVTFKLREKLPWQNGTIVSQQNQDSVFCSLSDISFNTL